jgi:hypothetical protein
MEEWHVQAQHLEAVMTSLLPLVSFASKKSCAEATQMLLGVLKEALHGQEASLKRAVDLKKMKPQNLMEFLSPKSGEGPPEGSIGANAEMSPKRQAAGAEKPIVKPKMTRRKAVGKAVGKHDDDDEDEGYDGVLPGVPVKKKKKRGSAVKATVDWNGADVSDSLLLS